MALKPDRIVLDTDVSFFMATVAERGGVVSVVTAGSGVSMDDANAVVAYVANNSGAKPIGILMNDVVDLDLTRQHLNFQKDEVQVDSKVCILRKGTVVTDKVAVGATPSAGDKAYVGPSGLIGTSATNSVEIGQWLSSKDADGYAKISVNL